MTNEVNSLLVEVIRPQAILGLLGDQLLKLRFAAAAHQVLKQHTPDNYFGELRGMFAEVIHS